jgi:hypothetical protein
MMIGAQRGVRLQCNRFPKSRVRTVFLPNDRVGAPNGVIGGDNGTTVGP